MIGVLRELAYRMRGNHRYAKLRELLPLQYLPLEELQARQLDDVRRLLRHAYDTVPYYKDSFVALGMTPDDIRGFDDVARLPVLSRHDLQDNTARLLSTACSEDERVMNSSGGTSGHPVQFYQSKSVFTRMEVNWLLCLSMAGWTPSDMVISVWGNPKDVTGTAVAGGLRPWLAGNVTLNAYRFGKKELAEWISVIRRYRKVFLYGYATVIAALAEFSRSSGQELRNIGGVITTAEKLYPEQRACIEENFHCKVHDQYGAREVPGVACQCEQGNMHLLTHAVYTEFLPVDDAGTLPEGTQGEDSTQRIILTDLSNLAMPIIRYEIGDYGQPMPGSCPCGRGYPLMRMDIGRIGSSLRAADGKRLYSTLFVRQMYAMKGVDAFQFRQISLEEVQLYIESKNPLSHETEQKLAELQERFPTGVCPGVKLTVHRVDALPRTQGGKHRHVICEVPE